MKDGSWNERNVSREKSAMGEEDLNANLDQEDISLTTKINAQYSREILYSLPDLDKEAVSFFEQHTTVDGSVDISDIDLKSKYFYRENATFKKDKQTLTRGYEYICSLDVALTSIQKIRKYEDSIKAIVEALSEKDLCKTEVILLLDYLRNALITIFNAFVYQEKLGRSEEYTSKEYQAIRAELSEETEVIISAYLNLIMEKDADLDSEADLRGILAIVGRATDKLYSYHRGFKLPSFYVSRPEASNPLSIMGASLLSARKYSDVDMIVGMPSGGTEFALTIKALLNKWGNKKVGLSLLPVSLHSMKQFSDGGNLAETPTDEFLGNGDEGIKKVLICDDNTSTGRTLQAIKDLVQNRYPQAKVFCVVAEADVVRSQLDRDNPNRTHVADKDIYSDAVNILPISRKLKPKTDLKELVEKKKIINYYKKMEENSENIVDKIFSRVMAEVNKFGIDYSEFTEKDAIENFHGTFLSNFYASPVTLEGKTYPSVEHAYQAAKFIDLDWSTLSEEVKEEIREALALKGYAAAVELNSSLFTDDKMNAGNIKVIADILRSHNYVANNWEDRRVRIMISMLLQKFGSGEMKERLKNTGSKVLIEGNDWNDALWGVSNGKGRNILGRILMAIRDLE